MGTFFGYGSCQILVGGGWMPPYEGTLLQSLAVEAVGSTLLTLVYMQALDRDSLFQEKYLIVLYMGMAYLTCLELLGNVHLNPLLSFSAFLVKLFSTSTVHLEYLLAIVAQYLGTRIAIKVQAGL